jgi:uncharacterized protein (DUF3820 family)
MQHRGIHYSEKDAAEQKIFELKSTMNLDSDALAQLLRYEMPYGKYKGRVLADLPGHYLGWFARAGFPGGQLGALLALMYELDHNNLRSLLDPLRPPAPRPYPRKPQ